MRLTIDMAWITAVLLVSIRIGVVFVLTPVFDSLRTPGAFRAVLVLALSVLIVSAVGISRIHVPQSLPQIAAAALRELVIGGVFAFGLLTAFGAFTLGGRLIDLQTGFGVASLIDPITRAQAPLLGTFLNLLAVFVFFAIDGHHMLVRGLAFSIEHLPPGVGLPQIDTGAVVAQFGAMFVYALMLVAPALFTILLLDVGMGIMARTMPQVNVFIVAMPVKIFAGLAVTAISFGYIEPVMRHSFESIFTFWQRAVG